MSKQQPYWIVVDQRNQPVLGTLAGAQHSAINRVESDMGGLDEQWEILEANGYTVQPVAVVPMALINDIFEWVAAGHAEGGDNEWVAKLRELVSYTPEWRESLEEGSE